MKSVFFADLCLSLHNSPVLYSTCEAICFNVLNGEQSWCRPCRTLRIVFRNVPAPDLGGQAKLSANTAKETDTNTSLTILIIAWEKF